MGLTVRHWNRGAVSLNVLQAVPIVASLVLLLYGSNMTLEVAACLQDAQAGVEKAFCLVQNWCCNVKGSCKLQKVVVASHVQYRFLAFHQPQTNRHHTYGCSCSKLTARLKLQSSCCHSTAYYLAQACCAIANHQPTGPTLMLWSYQLAGDQANSSATSPCCHS